MMVDVDDPTHEVTELLQQLIRNRCVNDGTDGSGFEARNADTLAAYLDGSGADLQRFEPLPGRVSLLATIDGSDPGAASLLLMGHTDVVPANPARWRHDPFGGELVDGAVWGRGAVDMLNLTSSMAVAFRRLAEGGFRPRGTLMFLAVADEEALGTHGARWLVDHVEEVRADNVVTEFGGFRLPLPTTGGAAVPVMVAEKGSYWCRITVRGTAGHASTPLRTDNALVKAADVVQRIDRHRPQARVTDVWRRFVSSAGLPPELERTLLDPEGVSALVGSLDDVGVARTIHACTHTTFAPTVARGGVKTNVIPDTVELEVDIRTLPGQTGADVRAELEELLADMAPAVEIAATSDDLSTASPLDTPLWDSLQRATTSLLPEARPVPFMMVGATDARFFRRIGSTAYGYGLFSDRISFAEFSSMFHGDDERIDLGSLRLSEQLWERLAQDLLA